MMPDMSNVSPEFAKAFYRGYTLNRDPEAADRWFAQLSDAERSSVLNANTLPAVIPALVQRDAGVSRDDYVMEERVTRADRISGWIVAGVVAVLLIWVAVGA